VVAAFANQGMKIGRYEVRSLMRRERLKPVSTRKFVHTTGSRHSLLVAPNVLVREFPIKAVNSAATIGTTSWTHITWGKA